MFARWQCSTGLVRECPLLRGLLRATTPRSDVLMIGSKLTVVHALQPLGSFKYVGGRELASGDEGDLSCPTNKSPSTTQHEGRTCKLSMLQVYANTSAIAALLCVLNWLSPFEIPEGCRKKASVDEHAHRKRCASSHGGLATPRIAEIGTSTPACPSYTYTAYL